MLQKMLITLATVTALLLVVPKLSFDFQSTDLSDSYVISRSDYHDRLEGFWLGLSIANWTGLITEMDKIGGEGPHGAFYTRRDWGKADQPSIWGQGVPSELSETIDWVLVGPEQAWGSDDDSDIEYIYLDLLSRSDSLQLSGTQIREAWIEHIYTDEQTPFRTRDGQPENFLWVSNEAAFELMLNEGVIPPETSNPERNPHTDMIDAQLTTELFGALVPTRPVVAIELAHLPIQVTARGDAEAIAKFYVSMHSLAILNDQNRSRAEQIVWMAENSKDLLVEGSYSSAMYQFVKQQYDDGVAWEVVRDRVYQRYQVEEQDGYDLTSRNLYCNGCFAAGINFAASLISLFYGEGEYQETVKLAVLMGWDSDNPAATWGGLIGLMDGKAALSEQFDVPLSNDFYIGRTRKNFPNDGYDNFTNMARRGIGIIDRVVVEKLGGTIDTDANTWLIPHAIESTEPN